MNLIMMYMLNQSSLHVEFPQWMWNVMIFATLVHLFLIMVKAVAQASK